MAAATEEGGGEYVINALIPPQWRRAGGCAQDVGLIFTDYNI